MTATARIGPWMAMALALAACAGSGGAGPATDVGQAWERASGRVAVDPGDGLATLEAARLALFARNDAVRAQELADEAARAPALTADADLLRTYLAWRRRDYASVMRLAMATIDADPHDDRAEIAAWMLEWVRQDHPAYSERVGPWLTRLLDERGGSPGLSRVAGRILLHLRAVAKDIEGYNRVMQERVGALTRVRTACPFGLFPALHWRRQLPPDLRPGPLQGRYSVNGPAHRSVVEVRERWFPDAWLRCDDWPDTGGVAYHEADVSEDVGGDRVLTVYGAGSWLVTVDGREVLRRDGLAQVTPRLRSARIRLDRGSHRIRMKAATDSNDHDAWMTLTADGVVEELPTRLIVRAGQPLGAHLERLAYAALLLPTYPMDDAPGARLAAERLLELAPESADGMYILGEALEADATVPLKRRRSLSRSLQRRLVDLDPDHLLGRYALGFSAQHEDRPEAALEHFERAVAINDAYYWGHYRRFEALRSLGWDREARQALDRALALSTNPTLLREAAGWFDERNAIARREAARDELERRTASLAPSLTAIRARDRGDQPAAGAAWVRRAEIRPWDSAPWQRIFEVSWSSGQPEAGALRRWAQAAPHDARLGRKRAELAVGQGRPAEAAAALRETLRERPGRLKDRRLLALLEGRQLEAEAADSVALVAEYRQEVATDPRLASWPDHEAIYLLDRRFDRVWATGGGYRETHRLTLLQNKSAIDEQGEWRPPQGAVLLQMRTLKADGTVLEPELGQRKGDLSFSGLVPGDVTEVRYLQPIEPDLAGGGWHDRYYLRFNSRPIWRAELDVTVPVDQRLEVLLRAGAAPPAESVTGDRRLYRWRIAHVSPLVSEPYQAPYQEWLPHVDYAYRLAAMAERRRDQLLDRLIQGTRLTRDVVEHARSLTAGVSGVREQASALFRWVRTEVDASGRQGRLLGIGASGVLASRQGNRALLLSALLRAAGIEHRLLVARPLDEPATDPPTPTVFRYSEPVIEVASPQGALRFAVAGDHALAGWLPEELRGAEALVVNDGPVTVERLPDVGGDSWRVTAELQVDVASGTVTGTVVAIGQGESTADLRRFLPKIPAAQRKQVVERALAPVISGLVLETLTVSDLQDVDMPVRLELGVRVPGGLERVTGGLRLTGLFTTPTSAVLGRGTAPGRYLQVAERKQPLMTRPIREELDVSLQFDQPVRLLRAQSTQHGSATWGEVSQTWEADGPRGARLRRTLDIGIRRVPADQHAEFADAMATVDRALSAEVLFQVTP